ncbi:hypothetical protein PGT21_019562 [Puccinia graminis f. sp. tritici]|uniref:Uncharacterized protein n=1 Tax=Puccinia graminis f. sp. tritici TaxID=56615 RepID=A0A5B0MC98_PUCGR|nr:hypothetical protein PGT21_019562 [Puccinia graminis f. sp. tritici]
MTRQSLFLKLYYFSMSSSICNDFLPRTLNFYQSTIISDSSPRFDILSSSLLKPSNRIDISLAPQAFRLHRHPATSLLASYYPTLLRSDFSRSVLYHLYILNLFLTRLLLALFSLPIHLASFSPPSSKTACNLPIASTSLPLLLTPILNFSLL